MSFSAHSAFLCDRLLNMFCSAAYKLAPPFGHIKVELCPGLESNSWTKSAKPQCLCGIILFVLLYRNHLFYEQYLLLSYIHFSLNYKLYCYYLYFEEIYTAQKQSFLSTAVSCKKYYLQLVAFLFFISKIKEKGDVL